MLLLVYPHFLIPSSSLRIVLYPNSAIFHNLAPALLLFAILVIIGLTLVSLFRRPAAFNAIRRNRP
jgi:hypothetical protein